MKDFQKKYIRDTFKELQNKVENLCYKIHQLEEYILGVEE